MFARLELARRDQEHSIKIARISGVLAGQSTASFATINLECGRSVEQTRAVCANLIEGF